MLLLSLQLICHDLFCPLTYIGHKLRFSSNLRLRVFSAKLYFGSLNMRSFFFFFNEWLDLEQLQHFGSKLFQFWLGKMKKIILNLKKPEKDPLYCDSRNFLSFAVQLLFVCSQAILFVHICIQGTVILPQVDVRLWRRIGSSEYQILHYCFGWLREWWKYIILTKKNRI